MSAQGLLRPRNLAIGGVIGAVVLGGLFPRTRQQVLPETLETPAMKQIGDRHSSAGGTSTHTPAVATKRGDPNNQLSNQQDMKGVGSVHFEEKVADQKANVQTEPEKMLNKSYHGSEKGR